MASITKTKYKGKRGTSTYYRVIWREEGRQRAKNFPNHEAAKDFKAQLEAEIANGDHVAKRGETFKQVAETWLRSRKLKPKTYADYESLLRVHLYPEFGDTPIQEIERSEIREFINEKSDTLSPARAKRLYWMLNSVAEVAIEDGILRRTFVPKMQFIKKMPKRELIIPSPEQVAALADECGHYKAAVLSMAYLGLRWAELAGLRYRHVSEGRVRVSETLSEVSGEFHYVDTKNHKARTLPIPAFLIPLLGEGEPDEHVFTTPKGARLRNSNFRKAVWNPAVEELGLEGLTPHHLRHFCASLLIAQGATAKDVMVYLGHSSIQQTFDVYGHLFPDALPKLAGMLDAVGSAADDVTNSVTENSESADRPRKNVL